MELPGIVSNQVMSPASGDLGATVQRRLAAGEVSNQVM